MSRITVRTEKKRGVYSGRMPKEVYMADETHPPERMERSQCKAICLDAGKWGKHLS